MFSFLEFKLQKTSICILLVTFLGGIVLKAIEGEMGINASYILNLKANFKNVGRIQSAGNPGPASGGGVDRFYDDGFNRVGLNGNALGLTSFWGYESAAQVPGNDTLVLNSTSASAIDLKDIDGSTHRGIEFFFKHPLGTTGLIDEHNWGFRESLNYASVRIKDSGTLAGNVVRISDAFALNGVIPPAPPFDGSFTGPGPLISDSPTRSISTVPGGTIITGQRELEVDVISYGLGPYWEYTTPEYFNLSIHGAILLTWVFSDFSFNETTIHMPIGSQIDLGTQTSQGSGGRNEFLFGGYLEGSISVPLNPNLAINGGARIQLMEDFDHRENGTIAELEFAGTTVLSVGLSYIF